MRHSSVPARFIPLIGLLGLALGVVPAAAQPQPQLVLQPSPSHVFEIAPFIGYRVGGGLGYDTYYGWDESTLYDLDPSVSYGLLADFALTRSLKLEGLVSHQDTHLRSPGFFGTAGPTMTVDHYQAGLSKEFGGGSVRPFLSGLLGFTRYHPHVEGANSEIKFGMSIGGGVKAFMADNYGVRFDARGLTTFGNGGAGIGCSFGGCGFSLGSWGNWQGEFSAAFIFAF